MTLQQPESSFPDIRVDAATLRSRIEEAIRRGWTSSAGDAAVSQGQFFDSVVRAFELVAAQLEEVHELLRRAAHPTGTPPVHDDLLKLLEDLRSALESRTAELLASAERQREEVSVVDHRLSAQVQTVDAALTEALSRIAELEDEARSRSAQLASLTKGLAELSSGTAARDFELAKQSSELALQLLKSERTGRARTSASTAGVDGSPAAALDYVAFQSRFRGPREKIKRRQAMYVDLFAGKEPVVDLGCGRGEFVELLSERRLDVLGVDANFDMVRLCTGIGLNAVLGDAFHFLETRGAKSLGGIFAAQVVEHLDPHRILELIRLCARALRPGGLVVVETVNPGCPSALANFYLDPTHVRPVPPALLQFFFEESDFSMDCVVFSSPVGGIDRAPTLEVRSDTPSESEAYGDYAIVATRL